MHIWLIEQRRIKPSKTQWEAVSMPKSKQEADEEVAICSNLGGSSVKGVVYEWEYRVRKYVPAYKRDEYIARCSSFERLKRAAYERKKDTRADIARITQQSAKIHTLEAKLENTKEIIETLQISFDALKLNLEMTRKDNASQLAALAGEEG